MKPQKIKEKCEKKAEKVKASVARRCGKVAKALVAAFAVATIFGCATVDQPNTSPNLQAGKSETMNATLNNSPVYVIFGVKRLNLSDPTNGIEFAESSEPKSTPDITILGQAQSLESSGTETYTPSNSPSNAPTATPTNDIRTTTTVNYGLTSTSKGGQDWIDSLTDLSKQGLSAWLRSGKANGTMTVTKADGTTECVTCKDGTCTTSGSECIRCEECSP